MDHQNNLNNDWSSNIDWDLFYSGMSILQQCHDECETVKKLQIGGASLNETTSILSKVFSPKTKAAFTRTIRGIIRTSAGISADIITVGAGGDVVVNSVFAIESSLTFIKSIDKIVKSLDETEQLFNKLLQVDLNKKIPITSMLKLDNGFSKFEDDFLKIFVEHVQKYGSKNLDEMYKEIMLVIDKIATTVSDWVACLFPDTAGLAGEITKNILDYIIQNGYTFIFNLASILPDNMQKMITNSYALKKLIKDAVKYLRKLIKNMSPQQIAEVVQSLGVKASDMTDNKYLKNAISVGTNIFYQGTSIGLQSVNLNSSLSLIPKAQSLLVYIIDNYIYPYISPGVDLFNQLFPLFLMFTLFIEKYKLVLTKQIS